MSVNAAGSGPGVGTLFCSFPIPPPPPPIEAIKSITIEPFVNLAVMVHNFVNLNGALVSRELMRMADLRQLLREMERDLGLGELSRAESDVLYAAAQKRDTVGGVTVVELQDHPLVKDMPRATFFRALRSLVDLGLMKKLGDERRSGYSVKIE